MPKTKRPSKASEPRQLGENSRSLAENGNAAPQREGPASPAEGAELIRAFLNIKQRDVRAAFIKLVTSLTSINSRNE